ncbi:hypothetical protein FQA39_LY16558 [Lamprigera yunnana]|nr:hypothetical protein FQA39_LY16558 [Lamprigera yunnana]
MSDIVPDNDLFVNEDSTSSVEVSNTYLYDSLFSDEELDEYVCIGSKKFHFSNETTNHLNYDNKDNTDLSQFSHITEDTMNSTMSSNFFSDNEVEDSSEEAENAYEPFFESDQETGKQKEYKKKRKETLTECETKRKQRQLFSITHWVGSDNYYKLNCVFD